MPIYEFYCPDCHTVFNFLSRAVDTAKRPDCPRCGRKNLERRASTFAVSKGRAESDDGAVAGGIDEARLERAMESLASEAGGLDESDPRGAARLMRRLYETAGLTVGSTLEEALRRMEAGEDPDAIDAEFGDALESEDPFAGGAVEGAAGIRRRLRPPRHDPELHEM